MSVQICTGCAGTCCTGIGNTPCTCEPDPRPNFEGYEPRYCREHRTVGPVRAWCHDCNMWCYSGGVFDGGCAGCVNRAMNDLPKEYVYRVTRTRKNPRYYQSGTSVKVVSRRSLLAMLKSEAGYKNGPQTVRIERAELGPWQEIGAEDV